MLFVIYFEPNSYPHIIGLEGSQVANNVDWLEQLIDANPNDIFFEADLVMY